MKMAAKYKDFVLFFALWIPMTITITSFMAFDSLAIRTNSIPVCGTHGVIWINQSN
jgi:hypothetical protein